MPPKKKRVTKRRAPMKKSAIVKIAKDAVKSVAEKKFFDSNSFTDEAPDSYQTTQQPSRPSLNDAISCLGFSTTLAETEDGVPIMFGGTEVLEFKMARPFTPEARDANLAPYALLGKKAMPVSAQCRWLIQRDYNKMVYQTDLANPTYLADNLPVQVRMVRVTPKQRAGTSTVISPDTDLFLTRYGNPFSVSNSEFTPIQMMGAPINRRRYTVLEDKKFSLRNPLTLTYTHSLNGTGDNIWSPQIANTNGNCVKAFTTNHQLSNRKGGQLYYEQGSGDPDDLSGAQNATTGQRREYVFFMFCRKGDYDLTGTGTGQLRGPVDITIQALATSKFIDA